MPTGVLTRGELGVRLRAPKLELLKAPAQSTFVFRDTAHHALVQIALMPWRTCLEPIELVIEDAQRSTRALYERTWKATPPGEFEQSLVRTAPLSREDGFSPLVSCARVSLPGGDGLSLVHRSTYRPGAEVVSARVLVPVARGTVEISVTTKDELTGAREAALLMLTAPHGDTPRPPGFQRLCDAVETDAQFPEHCLSRARAVMAELLTTCEVTQSLYAPEGGRVSLPHSGVSLIAPPRFSLLAVGVLPIPPAHSAFSRVGFSIADAPWLFEVLRVKCDGRSLEACCRDFYAAWSRQGVVERSFTLEHAAALGVSHTLRVSFEGALGDGSALHSHARWIKRGDDAVMLALNAEWTPAKEGVALLDGAAESLEWLPPVSEPASQPKPWWRFW